MVDHGRRCTGESDRVVDCVREQSHMGQCFQNQIEFPLVEAAVEAFKDVVGEGSEVSVEYCQIMRLWGVTLLTWF